MEFKKSSFSKLNKLYESYCEVWKEVWVCKQTGFTCLESRKCETRERRFSIGWDPFITGQSFTFKNSSLAYRLHESFCISTESKQTRLYLWIECSPSRLQLSFKSVITPSFDDIKENGQLESWTLWKRFHGKLPYEYFFFHLISLYFLKSSLRRQGSDPFGYSFSLWIYFSF